MNRSIVKLLFSKYNFQKLLKNSEEEMIELYAHVYVLKKEKRKKINFLYYFSSPLLFLLSIIWCKRYNGFSFRFPLKVWSRQDYESRSSQTQKNDQLSYWWTKQHPVGPSTLIVYSIFSLFCNPLFFPNKWEKKVKCRTIILLLSLL